MSNPGYPCYKNFTLAVRANPVFVRLLTDGSFRYDIEDIRKKITPDTRALFFNSPMNPTGVLSPEEDFAAVASLGIPVISDEIYAVSLGGIICICFLLLLYFMTSHGKNLAGGAHLLKSFAFATLVEAVIMIGGSLCVGAFVVLIYDFNDSYKLFLIWALLSSVLGILVFLSSLLKPDEQPEMPKKIYKSVLVYAQLSTYFALTAVLYLYLLKMVFNILIYYWFVFWCNCNFI